MRITEKTKGLTGSVTNIDTEELNELHKQNKALHEELEDARERLGEMDGYRRALGEIAGAKPEMTIHHYKLSIHWAINIARRAIKK